MKRANTDSEQVSGGPGVVGGGMKGSALLLIDVEYEQLQQVASSNQRRDDRLAKVRGKDFTAKLEMIEVRDEMRREGGRIRCVFTAERVCLSEERGGG